jgi:hypothetical protein
MEEEDTVSRVCEEKRNYQEITALFPRTLVTHFGGVNSYPDFPEISTQIAV